MSVFVWCIRLYLKIVSRPASSQYESLRQAVCSKALTEFIIVRLRRSAMPFSSGW